MRIITLNLNGIRAAAKKGFFDWLALQQADIVCLQEIKAQPEQLTDSLFHPQGYYCYYHAAEKKGYSGVALYARRRPDAVQTGIGWADIDIEGRYLEARFGDLRVISLYMHSGSSGEARQALKFSFMARFLPHLETLRQENQSTIICGDWNIAHKPIDLKNWKGNIKNSGFLPEERAWMDKLLTETGYTDAFRVVNPDAEQYTWWSNRGQAWAKNVGWRIDYHVISDSLKNSVQTAKIYTEQRFSDHAPVIIDYSI
ncbi:exodeoxyribonuclease III [Beggiatoa leptomitoformis]|uniref:Exodeoxyribonuclease III n=1 Tax=Beggiatoa leptomitoformis TaxID=288004 RepID=A0A2N9YHJ0_9GAMM|nr:exodeoxyribonuclease III [Beggiatoa leptomitoformis]ALG68027.1 exodeoxyribonuclease III [Beggiatoa leptomitoformis]AUI69686.1 exodeoxyribonuclease III [Beggiatoa leptomitoformis]